MPEADASRQPNRLIHETSPYLRQHAHNPVDWYPWGEEALSRARAENKPILLSIGYAACHWCHVMERESFENPDVARLMNRWFVSIKVDREERPDLDAIYMQATQMLTGQGGWPMTVFLTPEGTPFFAGTYFPPESRHGMPGFRQLLTGLAEAWAGRPKDVAAGAQRIHEILARDATPQADEERLDGNLVVTAANALLDRFDPVHGGLEGAPKFPQPVLLELLLRHHARTRSSRSLEAVTLTLTRMARGGIYDQLGGGFARYTVDAAWLVPHFEKMLYDNAQLVGVLVEAWQATHEDDYQRLVSETITYVLRDLTSPEGGFYASEDADSEGEEGRFYTWTPEEIRDALDDPGLTALVCDAWDVTARGNFEHGRSILHVPREVDVVAARVHLPTAEVVRRLDVARQQLFAARQTRPRPGRDEKVIAAWNGLMLDSLARAGVAFGREDWLDAARRNATFLLQHLVVEGRLRRSTKDGRAVLGGYLEDYAAVAGGLLSLYEATLELHWFESARSLVDELLARFADLDRGLLYFTPHDHERLLTRPTHPTDDALPSGNSLAMMVLLRMTALNGDPRYRDAAERVLGRLQGVVRRFPAGFGALLCALDRALADPLEVVVVGARDDAARRALHREAFASFQPDLVVAGRAPDDAESERALPLLEGRGTTEGRASAYVCRHQACQPPVTNPAALRAALAL